MSEKTLGRVAFEAYCEAVGGTTYDGKPIPGWDELSGDRATVQGGWEAAAEAIRQHMRMIHAIDVTADSPVRARPSNWQPLAPGAWRSPVEVDEDEARRAGLLPPLDGGAVVRARYVEVTAEDDDGR